jgi:hypothetical protein
MAIENKEGLQSTNDFALLGLKFLYFSNAGAIVAILANLHTLIDEEEFPIISSALGLFVWGLIFAFMANLLGYLMYRDILSKNEVVFGVLAVCSGLLSFFFFGFGAHQAVSILG